MPPPRMAGGFCHFGGMAMGVIAFAVMAVAAASPEVNFKCRLNGQTEPKARHLYVNNTEIPVVILSSRRLPHRLLSEVVAIYIRSHLGYNNVSIVTREGFFPKDVYRGFGFDENELRPRDYLPPGVVNLEMWVPPRSSADHYFMLSSDNYLGVVGRMGWFFPNSVVERFRILDHWRPLASQNSNSVKVFSRTDRELGDLKFKMRDPETSKFYCSDSRCVDGVFTPPICQGHTCAVLFASYFNYSSFLIDQVLTMNLLVRVAWIGPNLNKAFVADNLEISHNRSILFFHYTPDVLTRAFNLTSILFPSCSEHSEYLDPNGYFCTYEMHRFYKVISTVLQNVDFFLYKTLRRIWLTTNDYVSLIDEYNLNPHRSLTQVACAWMNQEDHMNVWQKWSEWKGDPKTKLYFISLFPIGPLESSPTGYSRKFLDPGSVYAYQMAVDAVNKNTSVLPDHVIETHLGNTACEPDIVMREFINIMQHLISKRTYSKTIGIVGPACSEAVVPFAGVTRYFGLPVISYAAEGAVFSNREKYPYFFRTIPENKIFGYVYVQLFQKFKWKQIAAFVKGRNQYSDYLSTLQVLLQEKDITLTRLAELKDSLTPRIIIAEFYQDTARDIFCEAFHKNLTLQQGYVWFIPGWYSSDWYDVDKWNENAKRRVPCTTAQMRRSIQGHIKLSYKFFADDNAITPENVSVAQWRQRYVEKVTKAAVSASDYAGFAYDTVWSYALALDKLFKEDHSYTSDLRSPATLHRFVDFINATNFDGVSGHVNFTNGASRITDIIIWQFRNASYEEAGRFLPQPNTKSMGRLSLSAEGLQWPGGKVPDDGSEVCFVEGLRALLGRGMTCSSALTVLCTLCFLALAIVLLIVGVYVKKRYDVKLRIMEEKLNDQRSDLFKKLEGWEIERGEVVFNRKLGEGQFGTVYGGECRVENKGWVAVAVKTLKIDSSIKEKLDFLSEAEMMKIFDHENIIKLIGVCTQSQPIYTIMEFMLYSDLKKYLLERRNLVSKKTRNDDDEVSNRRLTSMALDVAMALAYLAERKFVHRDVACRNCLVNAQRNVKLGDFGMTRPLNEKNYYAFSMKGMMPIRWMPPESLTRGIFTSSSDVWSFGVLLYEIVTFGATPFQGMSCSEVMEVVMSGSTLSIPPGIQPSLEWLLLACWRMIPSQRMTAQQAVIHLQRSPNLVSPSLLAPQASQPLDTTAAEISLAPSNALDMRIPDKARKLLAVHAGVGSVASRRKRSMSGNMVVTPSAVMSSTLEALNLNLASQEASDDLSTPSGVDFTLGDIDSGEDPLLPQSQYISTRFMSMAQQRNGAPPSTDANLERCALTSDNMWPAVTPV